MLHCYEQTIENKKDLMIKNIDTYLSARNVV